MALKGHPVEQEAEHSGYMGLQCLFAGTCKEREEAGASEASFMSASGYICKQWQWQYVKHREVPPGLGQNYANLDSPT